MVAARNPMPEMRVCSSDTCGATFAPAARRSPQKKCSECERQDQLGYRVVAEIRAGWLTNECECGETKLQAKTSCVRCASMEEPSLGMTSGGNTRADIVAAMHILNPPVCLAALVLEVAGPQKGVLGHSSGYRRVRRGIVSLLASGRLVERMEPADEHTPGTRFGLTARPVYWLARGR